MVQDSKSRILAESRQAGIFPKKLNLAHRKAQKQTRNTNHAALLHEAQHKQHDNEKDKKNIAIHGDGNRPGVS
jgi:hypothetical protein